MRKTILATILLSSVLAAPLARADCSGSLLVSYEGEEIEGKVNRVDRAYSIGPSDEITDAKSSSQCAEALRIEVISHNPKLISGASFLIERNRSRKLNNLVYATVDYLYFDFDEETFFARFDREKLLRVHCLTCHWKTDKQTWRQDAEVD